MFGGCHLTYYVVPGPASLRSFFLYRALVSGGLLAMGYWLWAFSRRENLTTTLGQRTVAMLNLTL